MKLVPLAIVFMAVVPPSRAADCFPFLLLAALIVLLGKRDYPTFETLTSNADMATAADPRLSRGPMADRGAVAHA